MKIHKPTQTGNERTYKTVIAMFLLLNVSSISYRTFKSGRFLANTLWCSTGEDRTCVSEGVVGSQRRRRTFSASRYFPRPRTTHSGGRTLPAAVDIDNTAIRRDSFTPGDKLATPVLLSAQRGPQINSPIRHFVMRRSRGHAIF